MRLLSENDVARLASPDLAIDAAVEAYRLQSSGRVPNPGRIDIRATSDFRALVLAGLDANATLGLKANLHSYASGSKRSTASFLTIWDTETCRPRALVASSGLNDHRTAAGFAAAARALNGRGARTLTIFGAGKMAAPTIRYLMEVCRIERVNIVARRPGRADALAGALRGLPHLRDVIVSTDLSREDAARAADIIVTVTTSDSPVVLGRWIKPGTLVILGGANRPHAREADDDLIARARVFVDHIDGCLEKAGDIRIPIENHVLARSDIAGEIGAVLSGHVTFEAAAGDIIVFKSIGLIGQDITLAEALLARAEQEGIGAFYDIESGSIGQAREAMTA